MSLRRLALFSGACFTLAAYACKDQGPDPGACQQTYGFGNYGCADIAGSVVDAQNNPVANATISAGASTDPYDHIDTMADATGHFTVRLLRRWISPAPDMDTVSTWIHAAATTPTPVEDSLFTQVRFYRLLQTPTATTIVIHIGGPPPLAKRGDD